jgi:hypothetical protein
MRLSKPTFPPIDSVEIFNSNNVTIVCSLSGNHFISRLVNTKAFALVLVILVTRAFGQTQATPESSPSNWSLGAQWAINHNYSIPIYEPAFPSIPCTGKGVHAVAGYRALSWLEFQAGVMYLRFYQSDIYYMQSVGIPLAVQFHLLKPERRFQLYAQLGTTVLRAMPNGKIILAIDASGNISPPHNMTDVYATYGLGARLRVAGPVSLTFELLSNKRLASGTDGRNGLLNLGLAYRM